jgi:magnesium and cobalt transporter
VAGLITIEDVLEQIVGEIDDEHDDEEDPILVQALPDGAFSVSALTHIADFNEVAGAHFSDEEFDTIGGMITSEFGHLPAAGEEIAVGDFVFNVTEADDRRVQQFHVTRAVQGA